MSTENPTPQQIQAAAAAELQARYVQPTIEFYSPQPSGLSFVAGGARCDFQG